MSKKDFMKGDVIDDVNERTEINSKKIFRDTDIQLTTDEIDGTLKRFKPAEQLQPDSFVCVIQGRRGGKTTLIKSMISEYTDKHEVDLVALYSKTDADFYDEIPSLYRFKTLNTLDQLIKTQVKVKKFNQSKKKDKDKARSRVIVIIDDFLTGESGKDSLRGSSTLTRLSSSGRHLSSKTAHNGLKGNGIMVIIITQTITSIPPTIRQNSDFIIFSKTPSRLCRKSIIDQFLSLKSNRKKIGESFNVYDCVNKGDFRFLVVNGTASNKYTYSDYIFWYTADMNRKPKRWVGDDEMWENNKINIMDW
tara:strand:+ start:568 stop:1485 length:918 start_codon:yes stop_codon:yes gene_type:complete